MPPINPTAVAIRGEPLRQRVLDAAEALLRVGEADFSMRDLAAKAQVSFATPFNQFGGKPALMQALSTRRIKRMEDRFSLASPRPEARDRILLAVEIATAVMLEEADVNRVVMGWLGSDGHPGGTLEQSAALWRLALGAGEGLNPARRDVALQRLPVQLALAFRGALSFWTAGELRDDALEPTAREIAESLLLGYIDGKAIADPGI